MPTSGEKNSNTCETAEKLQKSTVSPLARVVTSFGPGGWDKYAKRFVETFCKHWPEDVQLHVWYHDCEKPVFENPRVRFCNLNEVDAHEKFVKDASAISNSNDYRFDVVKFGHKVYAIAESYEELRYEKGEKPSDDKEGYLIWLDADVYTTADVTRSDIYGWLDGPVVDVVHLGRKAMPYSETSFVAFNVMSDYTHKLIREMCFLYDSGEVLMFREWHDGFIFERLLLLNVQNGLQAVNLSEGYTGMEAFMNSTLGEKMVHLKGNLKETGVVNQSKPLSPAMLPQQGPQRYEQLHSMCEFYHPKVIAETGTWSGVRAIAMAASALAVEDKVHYIGFDLFEDATDASDKEELNTKPHNTLEEVTKRLEDFASYVAKNGKTFTFELVKGDTNKTLAARKADLANVEFAFLDGGHSAKTVENDWFFLGHAPVVVFDDYFMPDEQGKIPEPEHCGTNEICQKFDLKPDLLPSQDPVYKGGITHLALVRKEGVPPPQFKMPVKVNPVDCVDKQEIFDNIKTNMETLDKWLVHCLPNDEVAVLVSGGPSIFKEMANIKKLYDGGAKVFCVKHSLNALMDNGITPYGVVLLDPRDVDGVSTHGFNRKELLRFPAAGVKYFLAAMTHPSVTKHIKDNGGEIIGWHAYSQAASENVALPPGPSSFWITGGTCSAYRAIGVAHTLGFRRFHMFGYDLCHNPDTVDMSELDERGRPKYIRASIAGKEFITTGELLAAAQDFEGFCKSDLFMQLDVQVHGDGIVPAIYEACGPVQRPHYSTLFPAIEVGGE